MDSKDEIRAQSAIGGLGYSIEVIAHVNILGPNSTDKDTLIVMDLSARRLQKLTYGS